MQKVIVTVKRKDEAQVRDLELPADAQADQLAEMIASALRWDTDPAGQPVRYQLEAHPPGRMLQRNESLAAAGAWDGSWLVLHPAVGATMSRLGRYGKSQHGSLADTITPGSPVAGWRSLGIDLASAPDPNPAGPTEPGDGSGFVWKQLDD